MKIKIPQKIKSAVTICGITLLAASFTCGLAGSVISVLAASIKQESGDYSKQSTSRNEYGIAGDFAFTTYGDMYIGAHTEGNILVGGNLSGIPNGGEGTFGGYESNNYSTDSYAPYNIIKGTWFATTGLRCNWTKTYENATIYLNKNKNNVNKSGSQIYVNNKLIYNDSERVDITEVDDSFVDIDKIYDKLGELSYEYFQNTGKNITFGNGNTLNLDVTTGNKTGDTYVFDMTDLFSCSNGSQVINLTNVNEKTKVLINVNCTNNKTIKTPKIRINGMVDYSEYEGNIVFNFHTSNKNKCSHKTIELNEFMGIVLAPFCNVHVACGNFDGIIHAYSLIICAESHAATIIYREEPPTEEPTTEEPTTEEPTTEEPTTEEPTTEEPTTEEPTTEEPTTEEPTTEAPTTEAPTEPASDNPTSSRPGEVEADVDTGDNVTTVFYCIIAIATGLSITSLGAYEFLKRK